MKYRNLISVVFILIFGLFETISGKAVPNDCIVIEEVINTIGNDLQKSYKSKTLNSCCDFSQIICQDFNDQTAITEIKFNNYKNLSNQDMEKNISQFAKLPHLTTLEMANNLIVGELPNNLSELKNLEILDLSGNCLEDNDSNTKLNINELYLYNADSCTNKNKKEKDIGGNNKTYIKYFTIFMIIYVSFILVITCIVAIMFLRENIQFGVCITCYIYEIFFLGSLLRYIYKGRLLFMLIFKYGYITILILAIINFIDAFASKSEKENCSYTCGKVTTRTFNLIIKGVYYFLAIKYINSIED